MPLSLIVAVSENRVIGHKNKLPWHLPADLKYFKKLTMGHHIIMGRKTFESIGKALPGRTSVVVSRKADFDAEGVVKVNSPERAIAVSQKDQESFVVGGAEIFKIFMPFITRIYLTLVHSQFEGDTFFDLPDPLIWKLVSREDYKADEKNHFDYSFNVYERLA